MLQREVHALELAQRAVGLLAAERLRYAVAGTRERRARAAIYCQGAHKRLAQSRDTVAVGLRLCARVTGGDALYEGREDSCALANRHPRCPCIATRLPTLLADPVTIVMTPSIVHSL